MADHPQDHGHRHGPGGPDPIPGGGGGGGVTDHGALTGLADNDHPQYQLASTAATDAELAAHVTDTVDAHAASAISVLDTAGDFTSADVEGVIVEMQTAAEANAGYIYNHLVGATGVHAASAIAFTPTGTIGATDVQSAIAEVAAEAGGGGGAPTTATYLTTTAEAGLSAEVVVGTAPGGELGGTWAAPTVDASHSGSTHAAVQAAAEGTAATALSGHTGAGSGAHAATAISFAPTGNLSSTTVQAAIAEVVTDLGRVPDVVYARQDAVTNTGAAETDLYTPTLAANTLSTDGDGLEVVYAGTYTAHASQTRLVRLYFGATAIVVPTATTSVNAGSFICRVTISRESNTGIRYAWRLDQLSAPSPWAQQGVSTLGSLNLTSTGYSMKITGIASSTGQITLTQMRVTHLPYG